MFEMIVRAPMLTRSGNLVLAWASSAAGILGAAVVTRRTPNITAWNT